MNCKKCTVLFGALEQTFFSIKLFNFQPNYFLGCICQRILSEVLIDCNFSRNNYFSLTDLTNNFS